MRKNIYIVVFLILLVAAGYYYFEWRGDRFSYTDSPPTPSKIYSNNLYGITFPYDMGYFLEEREVGNGERGHYSIVLTLDTEENRLVREGLAPGREGPTSITIDIFQNNLDKLSALSWIENSSDSNFKLSSGSYTKTTIAGREAYLYQSSGLYENNNIVIGSEDFIYKFSVSWLSPDDPIVSIFEGIMSGLRFIE